jgi:hypothetical protein
MQPHSVERARWCCRRFGSGTHAWCGHATLSWSWSVISLRAARERLHSRSAILSTTGTPYAMYGSRFCGGGGSRAGLRLTLSVSQVCGF